MATTKTAKETVDNAADQGSEKKLFLDEVRAELDVEVKKILASAKTEAAEILSNAKKAAESTMTAETPEQKAERKRMEEKVDIELFKDDDRYKDDLFVGVNGVGYNIKRGVSVKVPRAVAQVIRDSETQRKAATSMITELTEEFKKKDKAINA